MKKERDALQNEFEHQVSKFKEVQKQSEEKHQEEMIQIQRGYEERLKQQEETRQRELDLKNEKLNELSFKAMTVEIKNDFLEYKLSQEKRRRESLEKEKQKAEQGQCTIS